MNLPANTALPGLDAAIAALRRNGINVYQSIGRAGYTVVDTRINGRSRDGVPYLDVINEALNLEPKTEESR